MKHRLPAALIPAAVLAAALAGAPTPAAADTTITTQPYLDSTSIPQLHAQGLDGTGVTIAMIDGQVDTTVPELRGANITIKPTCPTSPGSTTVAHATAIASILASRDYGWAPKATVLDYVIPLHGDTTPTDVSQAHALNCTDAAGYAINLALNDGADIITISSTSPSLTPLADYALIRAADAGVPVTVAVGNDGQFSANSVARSNFTIGVGAVDGTGKRASYSNYGVGLVLMAYGGPPFTMREPDTTGALTMITDQGSGTSFAAPQVAGALALAKQKWPHANGNQLIRVMNDTIDGVADHKASNPTDQMGYGILNAPLLIATDPSGYATDNPLANKSLWVGPDAQMVQEYHDGVVDPRVTLGDDTYVYRGCDPDILAHLPDGARTEPSTAPECTTASPTTTGTPPSSSVSATTPPTTPTSPVTTNPNPPPGTSPTRILIVILAAILLIGAGTGLWWSRRKRPTPTTPPTIPTWSTGPTWPPPPGNVPPGNVPRPPPPPVPPPS